MKYYGIQLYKYYSISDDKSKDDHIWIRDVIVSRDDGESFYLTTGDDFSSTEEIELTETFLKSCSKEREQQLVAAMNLLKSWF